MSENKWKYKYVFASLRQLLRNTAYKKASRLTGSCSLFWVEAAPHLLPTELKLPPCNGARLSH